MASVLLPSTVTILVILVCNYVFRTAPLCWKMWVNWLQALRAGRNDDSKQRFEACVEKLTAEMRVRRVTIMVNICEPIIAAAACARLAWYICGPNNEIHEEEFMIAATFVRQIILLLFFHLFPSLSGQGAWYCTVAISWIGSALQFVYLFMMPDSNNLLINRSIFVLLRCATAILLSNVRHTAVQQIVLSVASCYCHLHKTIQGPPLSLASSGSFWVFHHESIVALCIIAMTLVFERSLDAEARATLYQKEASDGKSTAESLLSVMCDAVVHIGADMSIIKPAPKLAAMLMKPTAKLEGRSMCDLMTSDDSTRFQRVCASAQQDNHAKMLNVSFIDCCAMPVEIQLFIAGYRNFDDQPGYVVGLQESEQLNRQPSYVSERLEKNTPVREHRTCIASATPTDDETLSMSGSLLDEACPSEVSTTITALPTIVAPRKSKGLEDDKQRATRNTCQTREVGTKTVRFVDAAETRAMCDQGRTPVGPTRSSLSEDIIGLGRAQFDCGTDLDIASISDFVDEIPDGYDRVWFSTEESSKQLELGRARYDCGNDLDSGRISKIADEISISYKLDSLAEETIKQLDLGRARFHHVTDPADVISHNIEDWIDDRFGQNVSSGGILCPLHELGPKLRLRTSSLAMFADAAEERAICDQERMPVVPAWPSVSEDTIKDAINDGFDHVSHNFSSWKEETIKQLDLGRARFHHVADPADVISHNIEDWIDDRFGENVSSGGILCPLHGLGPKRRLRTSSLATSQFSC